mgnify:CR=1 FL=1
MKSFMDKEDQIEDDEDDLERAISEEEDRHENEVKDIQGKIFKENQFHYTKQASQAISLCSEKGRMIADDWTA